MLLRLGDDYIYSCYSSEVEVEDNYKSINYLVKSTQGVKQDIDYIHVLLEYRLRWKVDEKDNFIQWEKPMLLGTTKILFKGNFMIRSLTPFW